MINRSNELLRSEVRGHNSDPNKYTRN